MSISGETIQFSSRKLSRSIRVVSHVGHGSQGQVFDARITLKSEKRVRTALKVMFVQWDLGRGSEVVWSDLRRRSGFKCRAIASKAEFGRTLRILDVGSSPEWVNGFLREWKALEARPKSAQGVPKLIDFGFLEHLNVKRFWIATEFISRLSEQSRVHPKQSLDAALRSSLSLIKSLISMRDTPVGGRRVSHTDLSPLNIVVGPGGRPYIIDWGAAHFARELRAGATTIEGSVSVRVKDTSIAAVQPSELFLPPERRGRELAKGADPPREQEAWDVYGVGKILESWLPLEAICSHMRNWSHGFGHARNALKEVTDKISRGDSGMVGFAQRLTHFLMELLHEDAAQRPTLEECESRIIALRRECRGRVKSTTCLPPLRGLELGNRLRTASEGIARDLFADSVAPWPTDDSKVWQAALKTVLGERSTSEAESFLRRQAEWGASARKSSAVSDGAATWLHAMLNSSSERRRHGMIRSKLKALGIRGKCEKLASLLEWRGEPDAMNGSTPLSESTLLAHAERYFRHEDLGSWETVTASTLRTYSPALQATIRRAVDSKREPDSRASIGGVEAGVALYRVGKGAGLIKLLAVVDERVSDAAWVRWRVLHGGLESQVPAIGALRFEQIALLERSPISDPTLHSSSS